MKIFVGFGYEQRDEWIKELVFPLIKSFDGEVISGEELNGAVVADGVKNKMKESDVVFAFLTPRTAQTNGKFRPSDWVDTEYQYAVINDIETIAFLENTVEWNQGIAGNRAYKSFSELEKDKLLIDMSKILGDLKTKFTSQSLRLFASEDILSQIMPLIGKDRIKCTYRYMINNNEMEEVSVPIRRMQGGLFIAIKNPPRSNGLLQVKVIADQTIWLSEYASLEYLPTINLLNE